MTAAALRTGEAFAQAISEGALSLQKAVDV
jgi:hypothetical protein